MDDKLLDIVQSGILAPSADNEHVFRFDINQPCIRLWPTDRFAMATDALHRTLGLLSMGAVVENMRLRAGALGLTMTTEWHPVHQAQPMAVLQFTPGCDNPDDLAQAIVDRHTNRRMYHGPSLSMAEVDQLNAATSSVEGARLVWIEGAQRQTALRLIWRAESERFLRQQLHHDIFSSVRFDLSWKESSQWSLPPGSLEIEATMRPLFKALRHWALMRPLTWFGVHRLIGLRAGWLPAWQAPALGVLASPLPVEAASIAAGTALERLWLRATTLGLALQPLAASAVLLQPSLVQNGASAACRAALQTGWQILLPNNTPMMVFRLGRADPPSVRAGRREPGSYQH